MLGGKNKHQPLGYTIVEVMIVLAVSGAMFLIAANFINGKQQKTAFAEGVNTMASRLQDTIEQVRSGKYSDADLTCPITGGVAGAQGTNSSCVFLGKLMYLSYDPSNPNTSYETFTLAGLRVDASGNPLTSPAAAQATVIDNPDLTVRQVTPQNLTVHRVTVNGGITSYGIGFFQTPALNSSGNVALGGASTVDLYYVPSLVPGQGEAHAKGVISSGALVRARSADICLTDRTRYAELTLGANGTPLTVNVRMDGTNPC